MDIKKLRYFLSVVNEGSITSAAKKIPIAQPALTRQIRLLEESLNTRLLDRNYKGVALTAAGEFLYESARRLVDEFDSIIMQTKEIADENTESLAIGITTIHPYIPGISGLISRFRAQNPNIKLSLESMLSGPQTSAILEGRIDAGILFMEDEDESLFDTFTISTYPMAVISNRYAGLLVTPPNSLHDLDGLPFIRFKRTSTPGSYDRIDQHFRDAGITPNVIQECHDDITIRSLVATGMGYAIMPGILAAGDDNLIAYQLDDLDIDSSLKLAWRKGSTSEEIETLLAIAKSESIAGPVS
ncbi:LysR family transcriptional regulator [Oceanimonas sp. MB9]|uniref:LysR family transcriptional regulator n=1 Tax=Oceanimonas sp. MB9 TaxID=2588453 RepID=UPI0013F61470|nr:LysR family transcriptional regulator [Oceanimonas sp. MB9]NHH99733.1 HTH-type transcriptional regulator BenM [Oceanimonas sp. MB9]